MVFNRILVESLEAIAEDAIACGTERKAVASWIKKTGQYAMEKEMYEFMDELHRLYNKYKD